MTENQFYLNILEILNIKKVEYIIIGGYAVIYHGYEYSTKDMDIWYNPTKENAEKIFDIIKELGYNTSKLKIKDLLEINVNSIPVWNRDGFGKVDFMSAATIMGNLSFDEVVKRAKNYKYMHIEVKVLSYDDLIKVKQLANRKKDQIHIFYLEKIRKHIQNMKK
ncbi:MAG: hypothetical protein FVQ77_08790 [Cytophagales bacterium]|nr:hypothetical protein [Cytophagales bacterium]